MVAATYSVIDARFAAMASARDLDIYPTSTLGEEWIKRDGGRWSARVSRFCITAVRSPDAVGAPSEYACGLTPLHAKALRAVLKTKTFDCDADAFRAWIAEVARRPAAPLDHVGNPTACVLVAEMRMDPRLIAQVRPLAMLPGEISLGCGFVLGADILVVRGDGWMWCGGGLKPSDAKCAGEFPSKGSA